MEVKYNLCINFVSNFTCSLYGNNIIDFFTILLLQVISCVKAPISCKLSGLSINRNLFKAHCHFRNYIMISLCTVVIERNSFIIIFVRHNNIANWLSTTYLNINSTSSIVKCTGNIRVCCRHKVYNTANNCCRLCNNSTVSKNSCKCTRNYRAEIKVCRRTSIDFLIYCSLCIVRVTVTSIKRISKCGTSCGTTLSSAIVIFQERNNTSLAVHSLSRNNVTSNKVRNNSSNHI